MKTKWVMIDPTICHGQPVVTGTRIMLWQILELLETGVSVKEITSEKYFPQLTPDHIRGVLHFVAQQLKNREFIAFK